MKSSIRIKLVTMAALAALANYVSGCSVVGLNVGAAIDSKKENYGVVERKQLESVKPGTETIVKLKDGSRKKGSFGGFAVKPGDKNDVFDQTPAVSDSGIILNEYRVGENTSEYNYIPLRSIECIKISNDKNLKYTFMAIGLFFDALIILGGGSYVPHIWGKE